MNSEICNPDMFVKLVDIWSLHFCVFIRFPYTCMDCLGGEQSHEITREDYGRKQQIRNLTLDPPPFGLISDLQGGRQDVTMLKHNAHSMPMYNMLSIEELHSFKIAKKNGSPSTL